MRSHDLIWIVAIALMIFCHVLGGIPQVPAMPILALMIGLCINQGNIERMKYRLLIAGIASQIFWKFSGIGYNHEINDMMALFIGACAADLELKGYKWSGLLWVLIAIWLESKGIASMIPALIIYSSLLGGKISGYGIIGICSVLYGQYYYLSVIPLIECLEFLNIKIRISKKIKYSVYPVHLMALHFI